MNQFSLRTPFIQRASRRLVGLRPRCGRLPALLLALLLALPGLPGPANALEVTVEGERLSADLTNAPIANVLAAVAEQTGARLTIRGELGNTAREAFKDVPLAQALPRLARPNGLILEFAAPEQPGSGRRLVAIRAVAPGDAGATSADGASSGPRVTPLVSRQDPRRGLQSDMWDYDNADATLPKVEERIVRLGKITQSRGPAAVAALSYVLASDPDIQVRRAALGLLGGLGNNDARLIIAQSAADPEPEVRADALRALSRAGGEKPVSLLAQAVKGDPDLRVRMTGLQLLSVRDGDVARAVLQGAMSDPDPQVREAAQQALRR